jgi:transcriptional regulator with XRE-family HTH domain
MHQVNTEAILDMWKRAISARVREVMTQRGWSQSKLASELGRDSAFVSKLLNGDLNLTFRTLAEIQGRIGEPLLVEGLQMVIDPDTTDTSTFADLHVEYGRDRVEWALKSIRPSLDMQVELTGVAGFSFS